MSTLVVDVTEVVDNQKQAIGGRLKEARAALGVTQKELCVQVEMPLPSLRDYELGNRIPGGDAIASLVRAGINANWLLTGEGPMLLADLAAPAPGQAASPLDSETLTYVIEEVEKILAARRLTLPAPRKAALIQLIYDYCAELGKREPGMVERFLKFAA